MRALRANFRAVVRGMVVAVGSMMNGAWTRRNSGQRLLCAAALAVLGGGAAGAQGQSPAIPAHLTVRAEPECATAGAVAERVRVRSPRIGFVDDASGVPRLLVTVRQDGADRRVFELSVQWPDGRRAERRIDARTCRSGLDALALLLAMTLDPGMGAGASAREEARSARPKRRAAGTRSKRRAAAGTEAETEAGTATEAGTETGTETETEAGAEAGTEAGTGTGAEAEAGTGTGAEAEVEVEVGDSESVGSWPGLDVEHVAVGANGRVILDVAPDTMLGLGVHGLLALRGSGPWAPAVQMQLAHAWVDGLGATGGEADFALSSAQLGACPLGLRMRPLTARACLVGVLGQLTARGTESYAPRAHKRLWGSVGTAALLSLDLGHSLELQAGAELAAPLSRYGFQFRPEVFHRVPVVHFHAHLGAGLRFP